MCHISSSLGGLEARHVAVNQTVAALDVDLCYSDVYLVDHDLGAKVVWQLAQVTRRKVLLLTLIPLPRLDAYVEQFRRLYDGGYSEYQRKLINHYVGAPKPDLELLVDAEKQEATISQCLACNRLLSIPTQISGPYRDLHDSSNLIGKTRILPPPHMLFGKGNTYFPHSLLLDSCSTSD